MNCKKRLSVNCLCLKRKHGGCGYCEEKKYMNDGFDGTLEDFHIERKRLSDKYGTTVIVTGCYLCNYGCKHVCGKCKRADICRKIHEGETTAEV